MEPVAQVSHRETKSSSPPQVVGIGTLLGSSELGTSLVQLTMAEGFGAAPWTDGFQKPAL